MKLDIQFLKLDDPSFQLLDSLSLIDIVQAIEEHFQIQVHWSELNLDNFDSIERIEHYVQSKTN